jgi:hypothetical protein
MQVTCIKCQKHGSLSLNHYTSHGRVYKYYGIQHYDSKTKKRKWCYLGKYDALPESYKLVIHNQSRVSTTDTQTRNKPILHVFSANPGAGSGIRAQIY